MMFQQQGQQWKNMFFHPLELIVPKRRSEFETPPKRWHYTMVLEIPDSPWMAALAKIDPQNTTIKKKKHMPYSSRISSTKMCTLLPSLILSGWWFQPRWKIWKSVGMVVPNIWKVIQIRFQTTNQYILYYLISIIIHYYPLLTIINHY